MLAPDTDTITDTVPDTGLAPGLVPDAHSNEDPEGRAYAFFPKGWSPDDPGYAQHLIDDAKKRADYAKEQADKNAKLPGRIAEFVKQFEKNYRKLTEKDNFKEDDQKYYIIRAIGGNGEIITIDGKCEEISNDKKQCVFRELGGSYEKKKLSLIPTTDENGNIIPPDDVWIKNPFSLGRSAYDFRDPTYKDRSYKDMIGGPKSLSTKVLETVTRSRWGGKKSRKGRKKNNRRKTKKHKKYRKSRRKVL